MATLGASPHKAELATNVAMPQTKTGFWPRKSPILPKVRLAFFRNHLRAADAMNPTQPTAEATRKLMRIPPKKAA